MATIDKRQQILSAAADLFATQGYHSTTVSDIAQTAAMAQGTVYLYFDSKKAIFEALVDDALGLFKEVLKRGTSMRSRLTAPQFEQQVPRIYRHVLELFAENRTLVRLMLTEVRGADPDIEAKLAAFYDEAVTELSDHLRLGAEAGVFRKDMNAALVAHCLIAIMERFAALILVQERPDLDAMAAEVSRFELYGVLSTRS